MLPCTPQGAGRSATHGVEVGTLPGVGAANDTDAVNLDVTVGLHVWPPEWTLDAPAAEARRPGIEIGRSQVRRNAAGRGVRWRRTHSWTRSTDTDWRGKGTGSSSSTPARQTARRSTAPMSLERCSRARSRRRRAGRRTDTESSPRSNTAAGRRSSGSARPASAGRTRDHHAASSRNSVSTSGSSEDRGGSQTRRRHLRRHRQPVVAQQPVHPDLAGGPSHIRHVLVPVGVCWRTLQEGWWRIFRTAALAGQSFAGPVESEHATHMYDADMGTPFEESSTGQEALSRS